MWKMCFWGAIKSERLSELEIRTINLCNNEDFKYFMMFGKTVFGIVRSTFVLDQQGKIVKEYRKVRAKDHAQQLLKEL